MDEDRASRLEDYYGSNSGSSSVSYGQTDSTTIAPATGGFGATTSTGGFGATTTPATGFGSSRSHLRSELRAKVRPEGNYENDPTWHSGCYCGPVGCMRVFTCGRGTCICTASLLFWILPMFAPFYAVRKGGMGSDLDLDDGFYKFTECFKTENTGWSIYFKAENEGQRNEKVSATLGVCCCYQRLACPAHNKLC